MPLEYSGLASIWAKTCQIWNIIRIIIIITTTTTIIIIMVKVAAFGRGQEMVIGIGSVGPTQWCTAF